MQVTAGVVYFETLKSEYKDNNIRRKEKSKEEKNG
jgi:hypothetical protein